MTAPPAGWSLSAGDDTSRGTSSPAHAKAGAGDARDGVSAGARGRTVSRQLGQQAESASGPGQAVSVLANRLAAALVHHEPGWRLPRHSALARRYNVSTTEIETAIEELVGRHLIRRLADGQLYRASPADYVIGLEGVPGLTTSVDAMGGEFSCRSRQVTWRLPPEDISWALARPGDQQVCVVRLLWTAGGEPAALCTTYLPGDVAGQANLGAASAVPSALGPLHVSAIADVLAQPVPGTADGEPPLAETPAGQQLIGTPTALHIELQAPPPSVARSLRLTAGQPAFMITLRFADARTDRPVALTIAVLRPDMFRVVVRSAEPLLPDELGGRSGVSWAQAADSWES